MTETAEEFARRLLYTLQVRPRSALTELIAARDESIRHAALAEAEKVVEAEQQRWQKLDHGYNSLQPALDALRRLREGA